MKKNNKTTCLTNRNKPVRGIMMRKSLFKSRKAVSPLIATVLLIAFAVALGAVVMNWGRGYVEDTANLARERSDAEVTCTAEVDLSIVDIDNAPQVCWNQTGGLNNNASVEFILENRKAKRIEGVEIRIIGTASRVPYTSQNVTNSAGTALTDEDLALDENEAQYMELTYDYDIYGSPNQVKITPIIKAGGNDVSCSSNSEVVTDVKACTEVWT